MLNYKKNNETYKTKEIVIMWFLIITIVSLMVIIMFSLIVPIVKLVGIIYYAIFN